MRIHFFILSNALLAVACSSSSAGSDSVCEPYCTDHEGYDASAYPLDSGPGGGGGEAGSYDANVGDAPAGKPVINGTCSTLLPLGGALITATTLATTPPVPTGGTIADGTYFLTSSTRYIVGDAAGAVAVIPSKQTLAILGTYFEVTEQGATGAAMAQAGTFTAVGTTFTSNELCPTAGSAASQYTATATTFSQSGVAGSETIIFTYTKQP